LACGLSHTRAHLAATLFLALATSERTRERLLLGVVGYLVRNRRLESLTYLAVAGCFALGGDPTTRAAAQSTAGRAEPRLAASGRPGAGRPEVPIDASAETGALSIRLPDSRPPSTTAVVTALSAAETADLIERLEPLPDVSSAGRGAPATRPPTAPPARPGPAHPIAFVVPSGKQVNERPSERPAEPTPPPLAPPEIAPRGEVARGSEIEIRFDQPMVPVARVGRDEKPPVTLVPAVAGSWRWIDSRVLAFTPAAARLPGATAFVVTVPAGTRALGGSTLVAETRAIFATRSVELSGGYPASAARSDSPIALRFDQDIDPARVRPFLRIANGRGKPIAWRTISLAEARSLWIKDPALRDRPEPSDPGLEARTVVIAPARAWPPGRDVKVTLRRGAPSAEGTTPTARESFASFSIAPEFTVKGVSCGDRPRPVRSGAICPINESLSIEFSNTLDSHAYRSSKVQIVGEKLEDEPQYGSTVSRFVPAPSGRGHEIGIEDGLIDVYGQALVGDRRLSFTTGPQRLEPRLEAPSGLQVLDPRFAIPQWVIDAEAVTSVHVQLYRVRPDDFFAYQNYEAGKRALPPGAPVVDHTYTVGGHQGGQIRVDLRPALAASSAGHVVAVATATPAGRPRYGLFERRKVAWLQVTRLALSARVDGEKLSGWVHDITPTKLLAPVPGVTAALVVERRTGAAASAVSDGLGHVSFELPLPGEKDRERRRARRDRPDVGALLLATAGGDSTFVALDDWQRAIRTESALWYVTDDRFTYKPGEKAYFKGWLRWTHNGVNPDLALPAAGETIAYTLEDARGTKLVAGSAKLSAEGGFHVEADLPPNVTLGYAQLRLSARDAHLTHPISVQEFRTPAFGVDLNDDLSHAGAAPLILGESIEMSASARYYAGGGLPGAGIQWDARLDAVAYRPPGWDEFDFSPPWRRTEWRWQRREPAPVKVGQSGALSPSSTAGVVFGLTALPAGRPSLLTVDATITDLDRMSIRASSRPILVHPSALYVGIRLQPDHDDLLEAVVTDVDGNPVAGAPIQVEVHGVLGSERYRDDAKVVDRQSYPSRSAGAPVTCPFKRGAANIVYTATASVVDRRGRRNVAQLDIPWRAPASEQVDLALIPDKALYRPGDVAKLTIVSAVLPATAVVTFARQGMIDQKRLTLTERATTVELPIEPAFIKNVFVVVDRWGKRRRLEKGSTLPLPEHTSDEVDLVVDGESARLSMRTWPTKSLVEPGEGATFEVEVKRAGRPVAGAEVALMVVDEAVLSLAAKSYPDPLAPFYRKVSEGTTHHTTLDLLADQGEVLAGKPGFARHRLTASETYGLGGLGLVGTGNGSGAGGLGGRATRVVKARKDFRANAAFSPLLRTDANGRVTLNVQMPDSLTRFRIVALAAADMRYFGKAESAIVTQRTVSARTIAPRFLTQGDAFSLPVLVQNLDARPRTIDVAVRAANLVGRGPAGKRVTIPGGQRAEVRFDFISRARGRAVVQTIATSENFADASNVELPVYEPATTEAFATYGTVDTAPRFEQLTVPAGIFGDVGGVEVELASTQLQSLTDAYWYLYRYPYECAEQRSARMLATAAIFDILDLFEAPGRPTRQEIETQRGRDLRVLAKDQSPDGGWGFFRGTKTDPFVTMQVLQALAAVHAAGEVRAKAVQFVTSQSTRLVAELEKAAALPSAHPRDRDQLSYVVALDAEALTALGAAGEEVRPRAERLHALAVKLDSYPIDAKARLLSLVARQDGDRAMRNTLAEQILAAVHETASAATVTARYVESERLLLVSNNKTSALALDALIRERPHQPIIAKLARGLLDGQRQGCWMSTQENLVALQAIRRYFDVFERTTPSFTGKIWLGGAAYAERAFAGRNSARASAALGWDTLAPGSTHEVALAKSGAGRMYYRVGISYAPRETNLPALDAGFIVRRSYAAVDDPADVTHLPDGRIRIRLGAKVLITLEALTTSGRFQVALVDPLPAGFETVNEALATSERAARAEHESRWDFTNLRDERSVAFALQMSAGLHRFSYTVRAKTPGTFLAAPAKAEEMYSPETFGRSAGETVVIE
jgi:alpha-2-macroglobulin